MFGIDSFELLIVAVAALIFIGPKDLPRVMMVVGRWVGRARGYARHFTAGIENIVREAELEEMEKTWREENARIMAQFPTMTSDPEPPARSAGELPVTTGPRGIAVNRDPDEPALPLELPPPRELP